MSHNLKPYEMQYSIKRFASNSATTTKLSSVDAINKIINSLSKGFDDEKEKAVKVYTEQIHPLFPCHESTIFLFPSIIKVCADSHSQVHKPLALQLHCCALKNGFISECAVSNSLVSFYAKFSDTNTARKVFDTMPHRNTISWNSIINCYIQNGFFLESIKFFKDMYGLGFIPKPDLIASVLSACVRTGNIELGKSIHALVIVDERLKNSVLLSTALLDIYFKCHDQRSAFLVFDRMEERNEVSWTAMIKGYIDNCDILTAIDFFRVMQIRNIRPCRVTLLCILPVCAQLGYRNHGKEIHGYAIRSGFDWDIRFSSALIHMYCENDMQFRAAKLIFERAPRKDVVMWSCMITGYSRSKETAEEAIYLFNEMQREGIGPNSFTLLGVISACITLLSVYHARVVHGYVLKSCFNAELHIQNSLVSMYSKCGFLCDSVQIFREMTVRDSISWSATISAYGLYGHGEDALQHFHEMKQEGMEVDAITFLEILMACNHAGLVEEGQKIFDAAMRGEDEVILTLEHYACHIDLLGKAGRLEDACDVLSRMPFRPTDKILSSLVSACRIHGKLEVAEVLAHRLIKSEPENAANHTLLSMVYADSDNWHAVEEVRRNMKDRKLMKSFGFSRI